ncbi:uncharacterized protein RJT21DRAFT_56508 [Scheffersomyces amazonensis]|uniref:uncharacterized protein n=1 Tax=Scheffersomyces amazonensis TaxID=1078765 RepID=UPI00315D50CC
MDSSTIIFIATLAIAFVFLKWLITPIPSSHELEQSVNQYQQQQQNQQVQQNQQGQQGQPQRRRRQVTDSMIEVVQAIAPTLTREQIIMDLNNTGSVEVTIERYMELGGLPLPPSTGTSTGISDITNINEASRTSGTTNEPVIQPRNEASKSKSSINLLEKYDIKVDQDTASLANKEFSELTFQERRARMILDARSRYEQSLK